MDKAKNLYKDKKILILGLGLNQGGVGAAKFFAQANAALKVTDLKTKEQLQKSLEQLQEFPEIEYTLGGHKYKDLDWADLIIRNPGIKPDNKYLKYAQEKGKSIEMDMGIFLQFVSPGQIIGVTGTKGKSTTASLIYEVLKAAGKNIVFAGNIRKSVLEILPEITEETLVVLELSSFQLQAFKQHQVSPKWAVITNIYPDHLNYHGTMENYIEAKRAIVKYQTNQDKAFLNCGDETLRDDKFINNLPGKIVYFSTTELPKDFYPKLPGAHNLSNMAAALAVTKDLRTDQKLTLKTMADFSGIEYRLQLVKEVGGVKIYNDSAATTPQATIEALQALPNSILICGGMNKNLSYNELAEAISKYAKNIYYLKGDATDEIMNLNHVSEKTYDSLEDIVKDALSSAKPGDTILFSPGATSFNIFKNEFDRGEKFNQAVEKVIR